MEEIENKICPFSNVNQYNDECLREKCAWWCEEDKIGFLYAPNECAVKRIGNALRMK